MLAHLKSSLESNRQSWPLSFWGQGGQWWWSVEEEEDNGEEDDAKEKDNNDDEDDDAKADTVDGNDWNRLQASVKIVVAIMVAVDAWNLLLIKDVWPWWWWIVQTQFEMVTVDNISGM